MFLTFNHEIITQAGQIIYKKVLMIHDLLRYPRCPIVIEHIQ